VKVDVAGKFLPQISTATAKLPNVPLFFALVDHLRGNPAPGQAAGGAVVVWLGIVWLGIGAAVAACHGLAGAGSWGMRIHITGYASIEAPAVTSARTANTTRIAVGSVLK
jgi:hypothetical protein